MGSCRRPRRCLERSVRNLERLFISGSPLVVPPNKQYKYRQFVLLGVRARRAYVVTSQPQLQRGCAVNVERQSR